MENEKVYLETDGQAHSQHYLSFQLDTEWYAVEVLKVEEVLEYQHITRVPKMPDFMLGVINVRGSMVPVVDLRYKFGLKISDVTVDTCIIVLEVKLRHDSIRIGIIADSVEEVVEIGPEDIEATPKIGTKLNTEFIEGIGKKNGSFVVILDTDKIFTVDDIEKVAG